MTAVGTEVTDTTTASGTMDSQALLSDWYVVIARDGTVLAAMGGAPASWIGRRFLDCDDAPEAARQGVEVLLAQRTTSASPSIVTIPLGSGRPTLQLACIEALPILRIATDLRAVLHSALEALRRQANSVDVSVDIAVQPELPELVSIDPDKIAWVTTALVGNALRYVKHGSRAMPGGSIHVRATYQPVASTIAIEVQDDGPGIASEYLRFLFAAGPGRSRVGLGLLMVRDVVVAHGGHIEVESDPPGIGPGTRIRFTLPVS